MVFINEAAGGANLQAKSVTLTANGTTTYTPATGYDGFGQVGVTVAVPLQTKSASYTANGTYAVTPDSGKTAMTSVSVTVAIPVYDGSVS